MTLKERQKITNRVERYGNVTLLGVKVSDRDMKLLRELGVETVNEGVGTKFVKREKKQ